MLKRLFLLVGRQIKLDFNLSISIYCNQFPNIDSNTSFERATAQYEILQMKNLFSFTETAEAYLEPSRTSPIEHLSENS